jgi:hypothetical protein
MSYGEQKALDQANWKNSVVLKHLKTCMCTYWPKTISFKVLSFELDGAWVRHRQWEDWGEGDGQYVNRKTFIPYLYFDKTPKEIEDIQFEWSVKRIEEVKRKQKQKVTKMKKIMKKQELEAKKTLYLSLKKEFENGN